MKKIKFNTKDTVKYFYTKNESITKEIKGAVREVAVEFYVPTLDERLIITYIHKPGKVFSALNLLEARIKEILELEYLYNNLPYPKEMDEKEWAEKYNSNVHEAYAIIEREEVVEANDDSDSYTL